MNKLMPVTIALLVLTGCSHSTITSNTVKHVEDVAKGSNVIQLKNFDVKIKVNDDLQYVDQVKRLNVRGDEQVETYLYSYISEGKLKKMMTVEIYNLSCDNCTYAYYGQPGTITKGKLRMENNTDLYSIKTFTDTNGHNYIMDSAVKLGFIIPETVITKSNIYLLDKKNKKKLVVTYYEDATDLTNNDKVKIQSFMKRFLECTKIEG